MVSHMNTFLYYWYHLLDFCLDSYCFYVLKYHWCMIWTHKTQAFISKIKLSKKLKLAGFQWNLEFLNARKICVCCSTMDILTLHSPSYVSQFAEQPYKFYKRCFLLKTDWNSKIVHLNMSRKIALCSPTICVTF